MGFRSLPSLLLQTLDGLTAVRARVLKFGSGLTFVDNADGTTTLTASGGGGGNVATDTIFDAKGDLAVGTGADTASKLAVGSNGLILTADSGETTGVKWAAAGSGSVAADAIFDAKGDLAVGTGADTAAKLTAGANDTILMADSAQSTGLKWVASQTPSTQAFSDSAAQGTADTYARGDHVHGMPASPGGGGLTPGQTYSYPSTFSGDTINGSSTTPFVDVAAFDTKEVLNSRVLHLRTLGASKDQRVRVTLGTTKAAAFDVATAVAFGNMYWSGVGTTFLEVRLSTSADAQIAIARIGLQSLPVASGDTFVNTACRVGGSAVSAAGANQAFAASVGTTYTLRFVRDGSNVITFFVGLATAPMALAQVMKFSDATPFTATVSGTLARVEYSIHTESGPDASSQWDAYVDWLASV